MDEVPQKELVTKIALEDLQRRQAAISPQIDAQIEAVLKICEQQLDQDFDGERERTAGETFQRSENVDWDAEFNFWYRIIAQEVERLRFNEGYEPVAVDLYPATGLSTRAQAESKSGPAFMGKTQVGRTKFNVVGRWTRDAAGQKILRVTVLKAK